MRKKEKRLMDMDNSVGIAGGRRGIRELNSNGKNTIKIISKENKERKFLKIRFGIMHQFPLIIFHRTAF